MASCVGSDLMTYALALPTRTDRRSLANRLGVQTVLAILQILDQTAARMRVSMSMAEILLEMAIVRICHLENLDELASKLIAGLDDSPATELGNIGAKPKRSPVRKAASNPKPAQPTDSPICRSPAAAIGPSGPTSGTEW